ncbi:jg19940 [Pararge aegeria aegeria]|uniref:Jg19940 protein n=1 Tax=Pararge aegeria aegeria TaxID=348720 RepID=A0A8S4RXD2_9NEOP|nr:jg19940 [Pararge aegeria aegeria]
MLRNAAGGELAIVNDHIFYCHKRSQSQGLWLCKAVKGCRARFVASEDMDLICGQIIHDHSPQKFDITGWSIKPRKHSRLCRSDTSTQKCKAVEKKVTVQETNNTVSIRESSRVTRAPEHGIAHGISTLHRASDGGLSIILFPDGTMAHVQCDSLTTSEQQPSDLCATRYVIAQVIATESET